MNVLVGNPNPRMTVYVPHVLFVLQDTTPWLEQLCVIPVDNVSLFVFALLL